MEELKNTKCKPCEGYGQALNLIEVDDWLTKIPGWKFISKDLSIYRKFEFKGFYKTMAFANAVAWIANQENHHPTLKIDYNHCKVIFTTHALKGLSPNDFICAAKVNALLT